MIYNESEDNETDFEEKNLNPLALNSLEENQKIIPLLEERLVVNFTQRKTSEIVVRKVIETKVVKINIPVRAEHLIIEQVAPIYKQLATVELEKPNSLNEQEFHEKYPEILELVNLPEDKSITHDTSLFETVIKGEVDSIEGAHEFLNSIFAQIVDVNKISRIELTLRQ
jgi:stress response protein YsnF